MATIIPERRPEWLRVRPPKGESYEHLKQLMRSQELHAVCSYHAHEQADGASGEGREP